MKRLGFRWHYITAPQRYVYAVRGARLSVDRSALRRHHFRFAVAMVVFRLMTLMLERSDDVR